MKRTAAVCALASIGLAGLAGSALADKGGEPGPPSQPPGHSGTAPGQQKHAQPPAPAATQSAPAAKSAKPDRVADKPKHKPKSNKARTSSPSRHATAGKITICHRTGSQSNPWVQITVSANAWHAHQKHGDLNPVPAGGCPRGDQSGGGGQDHKITICHRTGSETNPWVVITVSENAWPAHRDHGDLNPVPSGGCPLAGTAVTTTTTTAATPAATTTTPVTTTATTAAVAAGVPTTTTAAVQAAGPTPTVASSPSPAVGVPTGGEEQKSAPAASDSRASSASEQESDRGVLGAARELGSEVRRQQLPFTGLPLWPVVLGGAGLAGAGIGVRRWARSEASA